MPTRQRSLPRSTIAVLAVAAAILPHPGCSGLSDAEMMREVKYFGLAYHEYHAAHGDSPGELTDLGRASEYPNLAEQIRTGDFVVIWDAVLRSGEENVGYVLAHQRGASETGGWVLFADGLVRRLDAERFRTLPLVPTG